MIEMLRNQKDTPIFNLLKQVTDTERDMREEILPMFDDECIKTIEPGIYDDVSFLKKAPAYTKLLEEHKQLTDEQEVLRKAKIKKSIETDHKLDMIAEKKQKVSKQLEKAKVKQVK